MQKTEHYQLNQWEKTDRIMMKDFNADNEKIDAALGTIPKLLHGEYTGNGAEYQTIELGAQPKLLFVWASGVTALFSSNYASCGLATPGNPAKLQNMTALEITESGFRVSYTYSGNYRVTTNTANSTYSYLAFM